jgi:hypothetical protein
VLPLRCSNGSGVGLSIADGRESRGTAAGGVALTSVWADVPRRRGGLGGAYELRFEYWKDVCIGLSVAELRDKQQQSHKSGEGFDGHSRSLIGTTVKGCDSLPAASG